MLNFKFERARLRVCGAVLAAAAVLSGAAVAQQPMGVVSTSQTEVMNARYITFEPGGHQLVENGPQRWFLNQPSRAYAEVKRTETEIYLTPSPAAYGLTPLVVDFAARKVYSDFEKKRVWSEPSRIAPTSGFSVSRVMMLLTSTNSGDPGSVRVSIDLDGTDNSGWKMTSYRQVRSVGGTPRDEDFEAVDSRVFTASQVTRTAQWVELKMTEAGVTTSLNVNLSANSCSIIEGNRSSFTCSIVYVQPISGLEVGHVKYGVLNSNNQWVGLGGITQTATKTWREETASGPIDWTEARRDARAITLLNPKTNSGLIVPMSAGSVITDTAGNATNFRVAHLQRQWPGQLGTVFQPVSPGVSPGFQIQNKTDYPVLVTLEQVGCLYYGIVQPGQVFQRDTGAVWFTIKASMAPDLKEPTVESCIRKPAIYAATIAVAGLSAAGTMGMGTALVVPAMLATAAGQGAAITTQQYLLANGATATGALAARVGISTLMNGATVVGLAMYSGQVTTLVANELFAKTALGAAGGAAFVGLSDVYTRMTTQSHIDGIQAQLTQEASVFGAYAGYPWPWKMADRVMPRYEITGGPRIKTMADGSTILVAQKQPLTITKVN